MTIRQKVSLSWIRSAVQPRWRAAASSASRAAGTCPRSGAVKKSRSSVARDVRCCASRAPPPARRKPLLAGRAKNSLATSSWKADRSGWPPPATTPLPRRRARSAAPTRTGPPAAKQGLATSQPAARHRRKPGCRRAFPLAARSRTPGPGRPVARRSNTRPGADQFKCSGNSTTARARATSSRGSRSGTQTGLPRADACWVNDACGSAASSQPAPERSRAKVATVGDFRPCSYADSVGRDVPARRASSSWVRPELTRTRSSSSAASVIHLVYPIG